MKHYNSLGDLLRAYRKTFAFNQERLAEKLCVELKTLQRWERNIHPAKKENLIRISEATGIPMNALIPLNFGQSVFYSIARRQFAYAKLEAEGPFHPAFPHRDRDPEDEGFTIRFEPLTDKRFVQHVVEYDRVIYPCQKPLGFDTLLHAARIIPDLNFIALDQWGHHIGHMTCLPLSLRTYEKIKNRTATEGNIFSGDLSNVLGLNEGVLYIWSTYGASMFIMHNILFKTGHVLLKMPCSQNIHCAAYSITQQGHALCRNLGMKIVFEHLDEFRTLKTEDVPTLCETTLPQLKEAIRGRKHLQP